MSDRERWTVYPLLFLALGVALRSSGVFGPTRQVLCHRLLIGGADGKVGLDLRAMPQGGIIQVIGANGQPQVVLESSEHGGVLATLSPNRHPLVSVEPTPIGGLVTVYGPNRTKQHILGVPANSIESRTAEPPRRTEIPQPAEPNATEPETPADNAQPPADNAQPAEPGTPGDAAPAPSEIEPPGESATQESAARENDGNSSP